MNKKFVFGIIGAAAIATAGVAVAEGWGGGHGRGGPRWAQEDGPRGMQRGDHRGERWHGGPRRGGMGRGMGPRFGAMFDEIDADGDGQVTREEAESARENRFAAMDANGDGAVDADELVAYRLKKRAERRIARLDKNEDGVLQIEEIPFRAPNFDRFDLDENGVVTKTELELAARQRGFDGRRGRGRGPGRGWDRDEAPAQDAPTNGDSAGDDAAANE